MHRVPDLDYDINLLVALRALLEEANVTRAGERIGMGQSTMSSALSRLRQQFDDELLVRIGRDYELTPFAKQLLPQVQVTIPLIEWALGFEGDFDPARAARTFTVQLSDYAAIELRPFFQALREARGLRFDLLRLPTSPTETGKDLLAHDFIVAVPGIGLEGESIELFRDEYVVIADRHNPAVADGAISMDDFLRLPHVRVSFGRSHVTPIQRVMGELGLDVEVRVTTDSHLPVPLVVAGTDLLAAIPRRLAERSAAAAGTVAVPVPFGQVELIERLWWHTSHNHDPAHTWVREMIAAKLDEIRG